MIKSELVNRIAAQNTHILHKDIERIVNVILEEIVEALAAGKRVELRGFGAFTVKHRQPRKGRNPKTGEAVSVAEKFVPFFKTGKELRERLNGKSPQANGAGPSVDPFEPSSSSASEGSYAGSSSISTPADVR